MKVGVWVAEPGFLDPPGAGGVLFRGSPPDGIPARPVRWRGPYRPGPAWLAESLLILPRRARWRVGGSEERLRLELEALLAEGEEIRVLFWGRAALAAREGLGENPEKAWRRLRPGPPRPWGEEGEEPTARRWTPPVLEEASPEEAGRAAMAFLLARAGPEAAARLRAAFPGLPATDDPEALAEALRGQASGRPFWRMATQAAVLARAWARRPPGPPPALRALTGLAGEDPEAFAAGLALWWLFHPARRAELFCGRDESRPQKSHPRR
jgi:hypothetical protein